MLDSFFKRLDAQAVTFTTQIPPKTEVYRVADGLFQFLFPIMNDDPKPARVQYPALRHELISLLLPVLGGQADRATEMADAFFEQLPHVYDLLQDDAEAFLRFDPAATCLEEVIVTYPGFHAVAIYRMANLLHRLGTPLLPRVFSEYLHGKTGIDIHPAATIGQSFFIDHGTGVVIGATTLIGNNVKIYQGVTLGALQVDKSLANVKRHPTIEDNCVLYANCTILGGKTVVGHDSVIGGNTWLTESVPPYSIVMNPSQSKIRQRPFEEAINFVI